MPVVNPNPKRIARADAQSTKPKLSRDRSAQTEWKGHKDKFTGIYKKDMIKRKVDARYTHGAGPKVVWLREWIAGPGEEPWFEYAVSSRDERTRPDNEEFTRIPPDRDTPGRAVRYVEAQFFYEREDGTIKSWPHSILAGWHTAEPHPDDAPADIFSEREIEVFRKREAHRQKRG